MMKKIFLALLFSQRTGPVTGCGDKVDPAHRYELKKRRKLGIVNGSTS